MGLSKPYIQLGLLIIGVAAVFGASAEIYKHVDANGKVTYSDQPPSNQPNAAKLKIRRTEVSSIAATHTLSKPGAETTAAAITPAKVVMYSASWCGVCREAKSYLARLRIPYEDIDVDTESGSARFAQMGGGSGVPVIWVGKQKTVGFTPDRLAEMLRNGGHRL